MGAGDGDAGDGEEAISTTNHAAISSTQTKPVAEVGPRSQHGQILAGTFFYSAGTEEGAPCTVATWGVKSGVSKGLGFGAHRILAWPPL